MKFVTKFHERQPSFWENGEHKPFVANSQEGRQAFREQSWKSHERGTRCYETTQVVREKSWKYHEKATIFCEKYQKFVIAALPFVENFENLAKAPLSFSRDHGSLVKVAPTSARNPTILAKAILSFATSEVRESDTLQNLPTNPLRSLAKRHTPLVSINSNSAANGTTPAKSITGSANSSQASAWYRHDILRNCLNAIKLAKTVSSSPHFIGKQPKNGETRLDNPRAPYKVSRSCQSLEKPVLTSRSKEILQEGRD